MAADDGAFKTRLSTKGQIVLPKAIRERRNWEPGAELVIEETEGGVLLKRAPRFAATRIEDVYGCMHRPGMKSVSTEEMKEAIVAEAKRRHARGRY
ncbi:MAG TPA: AbrB/MazE/SpoVT family DNA-binding domain-containing protein [Caulobacteraceae bacterium]|jgi:AbrB family looped-hinge helix DNA binding protein